MKTLIYITSSYPYGLKETYVDNELRSLANNFEKILLIPIYNSSSSKIIRNVPENVEVFNPILAQGKNRIYQFIKNFKYLNIYFQELILQKTFLSRSKFFRWFNSYVLFIMATKILENLLKKFNKEEIVLYSYWAEAPFFINPKFSSYKKVIRLHGGDFYIERNKGYLPLRSDIYKNAQLLLPISKNIYNRLKNQYNIDPQKIFLSYLGVYNNCKKNTLKSNLKLNVVSCSNVYPLKRIDKIYEILTKISSEILINWIHIGDGALLDQLRSEIRKHKKDNINVLFLGQKNQNEIYEIYETTYFDCFINTSEHEGLPVSIMEAFSFGIPAIATNVGGTSEIVNSENGILIGKNFDAGSVAKVIEESFRGNQCNLRKGAFETWYNRFNAVKNYGELNKKLLEL